MHSVEHDHVIEAIHNLELNLTTQIHEHTTALEVNNMKLENLCVAVDRHREILFGHDDGDKPGLLQDMNELKRTEKERRLTLRGVAVAFIGLVGKFCYDMWNA